MNLGAVSTSGPACVLFFIIYRLGVGIVKIDRLFFFSSEWEGYDGADGKHLKPET